MAKKTMEGTPATVVDGKLINRKTGKEIRIKVGKKYYSKKENRTNDKEK